MARLNETVELSASQARRLALGAQGFARPRPTRVDRRHVRRVFDDVGLIQIDSVNVVVRSQELPLWARLGPHDRTVLSKMAVDSELFEFWAHEASLVPVDVHPLLRWRMERALQGEAWGGLARLLRERPEFVEQIYDFVRDNGPIPASALDDGTQRTGPWWGWKDHKGALEMLFWTGRISARRGTNFERRYDVAERIIPREVLAQATPAERDAHKALLVRASKHLGVGTARDLADYYRLKVPQARPLLDELVDEGVVVAARVEGWRDRAFLNPSATVPRRVDATALLSPFDSLVWERDRTERIFNFRYRLEIYTPAPKRIYGYYVLPFLLGDALVARVDVKADRQASTLRIFGAYGEAGCALGEVADALASELRAFATWLGLDDVAVSPPERGDLAPLLKARFSRPRAGRPSRPTSG